jgi:hypothetical protein
MKIFYHNSETGEEVPSAKAVESDYAGACRLFAHLVRAESFFGIILGDGRVLQIYLERDGSTHLEILDREQKETLSAAANTPIAEASIEAAFSGKEIQGELGMFFLKWKRSKLSTA